MSEIGYRDHNNASKINGGIMERDNSGIMFISTKKTSDKAPEFKGEATIGGIKYQVAGWRKSSERCSEFITLSFEAEETRTPF